MQKQRVFVTGEVKFDEGSLYVAYMTKLIEIKILFYKSQKLALAHRSLCLCRNKIVQ